MQAPTLINTKKDYKEPFLLNNKKIGEVKDFWSWAYSSLSLNINRAALAEYIIAMALDLTTEIRNEYEPFDLLYNDIKIEVKSAGFIQSWYSNKLSKPSFSIAPAEHFEDNLCIRRSDVYIFCLQTCTEPQNLNPLNLEQWAFYCVPTSLLNEIMPIQKTISLNKLTKLVKKITYNEIKEALLKYKENFNIIPKKSI